MSMTSMAADDVEDIPLEKRTYRMPQAVIEALGVALGLVEVKVSLSDVVFLKSMILIMCYRSLSLHTARRS